MKRFLIMEDGTIVEGEGFGSDRDSYGELVFTTSMTGYLESITDPSYRNQILVFASPTIGNYDIRKGAMESSAAQVAGVVIRDAHSVLHSDPGWKNFEDFLYKNEVPGIDLVDTRMLVRKIREKGTIRCHISSSRDGRKEFPDPMAEDLVSKVACRTEFRVSGSSRLNFLYIDVGTKNSLLAEMAHIGNLHVVPYDFAFSDSLDKYDAIFISNGPGDPGHPSLTGVVDLIRKSVARIPVYGVCLGHELIAMAFGGKTVKMKFGHRGSNHAVTDGQSLMITTHNHGYAVDESSLSSTPLRVVQRDINDGTVEKVRHASLKVESVQYHPEASPGPHDARAFFSGIRKDLEEA